MIQLATSKAIGYNELGKCVFPIRRGCLRPYRYFYIQCDDAKLLKKLRTVVCFTTGVQSIPETYLLQSTKSLDLYWSTSHSFIFTLKSK